MALFVYESAEKRAAPYISEKKFTLQRDKTDKKGDMRTFYEPVLRRAYFWERDLYVRPRYKTPLCSKRRKNLRKLHAQNGTFCV